MGFLTEKDQEMSQWEDARVIALFTKYERIDRLAEGRYRVKEQNRWGVFSTENDSLVVPIEFDAVGLLTTILFQVWRSGKCGVFSTISGSVVVPIDFDTLSRLTDTLYLVEQRGDPASAYSAVDGSMTTKC